MRLSARDVDVVVRVLPESSRPIRLRTGALTYGLDVREAVDLATKLADAVAEINEGTHHE